MHMHHISKMPIGVTLDGKVQWKISEGDALKQENQPSPGLGVSCFTEDFLFNYKITISSLQQHIHDAFLHCL